MSWLSALSAHAHEFELTEASVTLDSSTELRLSIDADLVELLSNQFAIDGSSEEVIASVRALSLTEVAQASSQFIDQLSAEVGIYIDNQPARLQPFAGVPAEELYQRLQLEPEGTNYRAEFTSTAIFESGTELQARFPKSLGSVSLFISSPQHTLLLPNELSNGYLMELSGIQGFSTKAATAVNYAHHGFLHVLPYGLDHILFVVALCLLSTGLVSLIWQISAFTLAHTITLGLSSAGVVSLPSEVVEPIIALSIAWVAFENLFVKNVHHWRILIIFLFGLIHGLGFAGALMELGLSPSQWLTSLIFFNIGVELGQLTVVVLTFALLFWFLNKPWYPKWVQTPLSVLIGITGLYWAFERIF